MSLPVDKASDSEGLLIRDFKYIGSYLAGSYSTTTTVQVCLIKLITRR
jgi:hypothetical protein